MKQTGMFVTFEIFDNIGKRTLTNLLFVSVMLNLTGNFTPPSLQNEKFPMKLTSDWIQGCYNK